MVDLEVMLSNWIGLVLGFLILLWHLLLLLFSFLSLPSLPSASPRLSLLQLSLTSPRLSYLSLASPRLAFLHTYTSFKLSPVAFGGELRAVNFFFLFVFSFFSFSFLTYLRPLPWRDGVGNVRWIKQVSKEASRQFSRHPLPRSALCTDYIYRTWIKRLKGIVLGLSFQPLPSASASLPFWCSSRLPLLRSQMLDRGGSRWFFFLSFFFSARMWDDNDDGWLVCLLEEDARGLALGWFWSGFSSMVRRCLWRVWFRRRIGAGWSKLPGGEEWGSLRRWWGFGRGMEEMGVGLVFLFRDRRIMEKEESEGLEAGFCGLRGERPERWMRIKCSICMRRCWLAVRVESG